MKTNYWVLLVNWLVVLTLPVTVWPLFFYDSFTNGLDKRLTKGTKYLWK